MKYFFNLILLTLSLMLSKVSFAQNSSFDTIIFQNLTYIKKSIFVDYQVQQVVNNQSKVINKKYKLPDSLVTKFLELIDSSKILTITSNNKVCIDCIPFAIIYQKENAKQTKILAYQNGMTTGERSLVDDFHQAIFKYTNYYYEDFRNSLPAGEYVSNRGMSITREWKQDGLWFRETDYPLIVLDGNIISPLHFQKEEKKFTNKDNYTIEILKDPSATALYGIRGANGVVIIKTK